MVKPVQKFSITDNSDFERSSYQNGKAKREKSTGRIWYLDELHRDHYEIFNSDGTGYGIADLNGKVDTTSDKAIKVKKELLIKEIIIYHP